MTDDDLPMTSEERALSELGAAILAAAIGRSEARAPFALRESIERARAVSPPRRLFRGRSALAGAGLTVVFVALVLTLGRTSAPGVTQIASITRLPAQQAAPVSTGGAMPHLRIQVGKVAFPDWAEAFGWVATGQRFDRVAGRAITTIAYRDAAGAALGYAIVDGAPIGGAPAGEDVRRGVREYRVARAGGRTTVTWTQAGHTCVIDAPAAVRAAELLELAAWDNA